jgi:transmembrane sensor
MNTGASRAQISEQILEEACGWFIDCNEGELDASGREGFNQWLHRSPEHVRAYLEIAAAWQDSSRLNGAQPLDPAALVAESIAESNVVVVPFDMSVTQPGAAATDQAPRKTWGGKLPWLFFTAAAAVLLAVGVRFMRPYNVYTTGVGELHSIMLADGSAVELDTHSQLRVHFSNTERMVELVYGQAVFQVKKDAARPFIVLSSGTHVRAVGTQFDVYRKTTGTTITVIEGRVSVTEVTSAAGSGTPILISAGEQLTLALQTVPHAVHTDVAAAIAWTQRKLVFDETPLSEVVAEFNRYNSSQIVIDDASLANYHIRGEFAAGDPGHLLQFLRDRFNADVREQGNEIRISRD